MPPAIRLLLRIVAPLIAALSILLAAAALRLSYGPVSVEFLSPYLRDALSAGEAAIAVEFEEPTLGWPAWNRALEIRARRVRVITPGGEPLASAPEILVGLSGRALLRGLVAPTRLDLIGPQFQLRIGRDGRLDLGVSSGEALIAPLAEELLKTPRPDRATGYLTRVSVLEAGVTIADEDLIGHDAGGPPGFTGFGEGHRIDSIAARRIDGFDGIRLSGQIEDVNNLLDRRRHVQLGLIRIVVLMVRRGAFGKRVLR